MDLHVIYTRSDRTFLSRRQYESWQQIQDEITDYVTSLGPWSPEEMVEYLGHEHPGLDPSPVEQVSTFLASIELIVELKFMRDR